VTRGQGPHGGYAWPDTITPGVRDRAEDEVAATLDAWRALESMPDPFDGDEDDEDLPALPPARAGWHREAACRGLLGTPAWAAAFFPASDDGGDNHGAAAKAVCATCPVWTECLTEAVDARERVGIWGGAGGAQLRELSRARRRGADAWQVALEAHRHDLDDIAAGRRPAGARVAYGAGAVHGRPATYAKGCRCEPCQLASVTRSHARPTGRVHHLDATEAA
jgi:WhiB family redox-sensing transcriptional regulator